MQKWNTIVVDDEPMGRQRVVGLLERDEEIEVLAEYGDVASAAAGVADALPDLILLDIEMPDADGFQLLESIQSTSAQPEVIFVTAHDSYAIRAFDSEAADYVLKPFSNARFQEAIERAKKRLRDRRTDELVGRLTDMRRGGPSVATSASVETSATGAGLRKILVRTRGNKIFVDVADIDYIAAEDYHTRVHTRGSSYLVRRTMSWFEERLDPRRFVRVHRSYIVNVDRVSSIKPWSGGSYDILLEGGTSVRLSAARKEVLERVIGQEI